LRPITGAPFSHREVHHLADLAGVGGRQRTAEHGEVLGEDVDEPPVDPARARDHAIAQDLLVGHAEVGAVVGDEAVELHERAHVEQRLHPLARGAFALLVLVGHALGAAAEARGLRHRGEAGELVSAVHRTSVGPHG
jgi:hypothetical protein